MRGLRVILAVVASVLALAGAEPGLAGGPLPKISGAVILKLTGLDAARFPGGEVDFDLGRLEALGQTHIRTSTIWTDGVHDFTGVPLNRLTGWLGISSGVFHAIALNDYAVDVPVTDAMPEGPIIAYEFDGRPMSIREKGPLWIVYPFDQNPAYRNEVIYTRSVWHLEELKLER